MLTETALIHRSASSRETLLPEEIADAISRVAGATSFGIRISSVVVFNLLEAARLSCQGSIDITRSLTEMIMSSATGKRYRGNQEYDIYLESWSNASIHLIYSTLSLVELLHSASFSLLQSATYLGFSTAEEGVRLIDSFFGSNDTSKTLAGVLCLLRRQFHDQGHNEGILIGLTKSMTTFAILQGMMHARTLAERVQRIKHSVRADLDDHTPQYSLQTFENSSSKSLMASNNSVVSASMHDFHNPADIFHTPEADFVLSTEESLIKTTFVEVDTTKKNLVDSDWVRRTNAVESRSVTGKTRFTIKNVTRKLKTSNFIRSVSGEKRRARSPEEPVSSRTSPTRARNLPRLTRTTPHQQINDYSDNIPNSRIPIAASVSRRPLAVLPDHSNRRLSPRNSLCSAQYRRRTMSTLSISSIQTISGALIPISQEVASSQSTYWPPAPFAHNLYRFLRFSTAAYGQAFLRLLGLNNIRTVFTADSANHQNHHAFAAHIGIDVDAILLSSYSPANTAKGQPGLIYFLSLDHISESVVLTLRGTLGLSDLLTDLTGEYDDFVLPWDQNRHTHQAHSGILAAANVLAKCPTLLGVLRRAFLDCPHYGLVICGHSLGAGCAALLGMIWSTPATIIRARESHFTGSCSNYLTVEGCPRTPIGVFCYAPPATVSPSLIEYSRTLIVTAIMGNDLVPFLSFGMLKDFKNIALALHQDNSQVMSRLKKYLIYGTAASTQDEDYFYSVLRTLRCELTNEKLVPPGQINVLATSVAYKQVENRTIELVRVTCEEVDDVCARFGELIFSRDMLLDHSPARYEVALKALLKGLEEQNSD